MPDLSRMADTVREQVRRTHASLDAARQSAASGEVLSAAYGELGNLLLAAEYHEAAEPCYLAAEETNPSEFRWPYYLGHVHQRRNDPDRAAAAFERALRLQPAYAPAHLSLGEVHLVQGRPDAAERAFTSALASPPHRQAALFGLGRAALARQDHAGAAEHLESALAIDRRASAIRYPLATAYDGLGQPVRAETHLRERGDVRPATIDPLMDVIRGLLHSAARFDGEARQALSRGDWPAAVAAARAGIDLTSDDPRVEASLRHRLGTALAQTGDARGALEEFQRAVRLAPDFARGHYSLGILLASSGRRTEAIEHLSAAVKLDPNYREAREALAALMSPGGPRRLKPPLYRGGRKPHL
ncbi:MAG: tetratricopeptide repeat protein [Acidobacteria bacterium]|nr:tetratricopeptide repeat protein [Acidobacteriota bacterium]